MELLKRQGLTLISIMGPIRKAFWGGPIDKEDAKEHLELLLRKWKEYLERYLENYLNEELREVMRAI